MTYMKPQKKSHNVVLADALGGVVIAPAVDAATECRIEYDGMTL